jgi:hypothetical protein
VGYNLEDALQELDDCPVFEGSAKEYTEDYVDSCGLLDSLPEPVTVGRVRPLCLRPGAVSDLAMLGEGAALFLL